jgi:UDP-2,4-diacetamido-2,4,6-trideoxy-beta-L-altropyranose hydrolase
MRCLALAQAWQDAGGSVVFAISECPPDLAKHLRSEGVEIFSVAAVSGSERDAGETAELATARSAAWVIVDGYQFGINFQKGVDESGLKLLLIDDVGDAPHFHAAAILNHNVYAVPELYDGKVAGAELLLGPRYALLRREFYRWHGWRREHQAVARKMLVTMGGSDPENATLSVLMALQQVAVANLDVKVMVGSANPHYDDLSRFVRQTGFHIELMRNVTDVPAWMAWADVAVSGAGITCLELAFMQLPAIILTLAENQRLVAEHLSRQRLAVSLGEPRSLGLQTLAVSIARLLQDLETRTEMGALGRAAVDGEGARRVVRHLRRTALRLRRVGEGDSRLLWEWANDPEVRAVSFSTAQIAWDDHVRWLRGKLDDPGCYFYLALDGEGLPVGQIRFDINGQRATISVSMESNSRGLGYGSRVIQLGSRQIFAETPVQSITAYVKADNHASARAFAKAGYISTGEGDVAGQPALQFVMQRRKLEGLH